MVYFNVSIFPGLSAVFAFSGMKYKMKKGKFDAESVEQAIRD
jgi:hypothetical protein